MWKFGDFHYTVRGLLVFTAALASVFGLAHWLDDYGGLVVAIPIAVLPLCVIVESAFSGPSISCSRKPLLFYVWRHFVLVVAALTTAGTAWIASSSGVPKLSSPLPFLMALPMFFGLPWTVILAIPGCTFLMFNLYLGRATMPHPIPLRFPMLLAIATAFSLYWFAMGIPFSIGYHGPMYTIGITIINSAIALALWAAWLSIRRNASYWTALAWALALHHWLFWLAFPWLGELP